MGDDAHLHVHQSGTHHLMTCSWMCKKPQVKSVVIGMSWLPFELYYLIFTWRHYCMVLQLSTDNHNVCFNCYFNCPWRERGIGLRGCLLLQGIHLPIIRGDHFPPKTETTMLLLQTVLCLTKGPGGIRTATGPTSMASMVNPDTAR